MLMKIRMLRRASPAVAIVVWFCAAGTSRTALGEDWPQWRGPGRDAVSRETGLLQE